MSKKDTSNVELITKFLTLDSIQLKKIDTVEKVLELPASAYKFLEEKDISLIKKLFNVSKIGEFATIDQDSPYRKVIESEGQKKIDEILKLNPRFDENLKRAITISLIARRLKFKTLKVDRKEQKVIVIGLNNAGKTAILSKFGGKLGISDLAKLKPTKGINRQEVKTSELTLSIWDFGGQKDYRDKYLTTPEKYFFGVNLIIYVIDVQDPTRYDESIEYFDKIINIVNNLEEHPYVLIFIHKVDPDIKDQEDTVLNIELIKDLISAVFKDKKLDYDIYLSSIYSMISSEPNFAKYIKDVMKESMALTDPTKAKMEEIGKIVESSLNAVVRLSESVMTQFQALEARINVLESSRTSTSGLPLPISSSQPLPPPPPPSGKMLSSPAPAQGGLSARSMVVSELRELFAKKKKIDTA